MMKNCKPYKKYKPSGIAWLGDIPEHWERWKLNRLLFFQEGPGLRNWQFKDSGVKVICVTNIVPPRIDFSKMVKYISLEEYNEKYQHFTVDRGDILLASSGASWGKVATYTDEEKVILNTSTIRLKSKRENLLSNIIIKYLLNAPYVNTQLQNLLTGSCQPNFGPTHLDKLYIALPSLLEQERIAAFLEFKLSKIDRFIRKKKQLIKLLNEQKAGIINHAVTKGIDPNAKMKPSGIEWLGDIPEHWEVMRLKYLAKICNGSDCNKQPEGKYPVYGSGGIFGWNDNYIYDKPSVLLGRKGTIDKPIIVYEPFWTVDTAFYTKIKTDLVDILFFYYLCCSIPFGFYSSKTALPSMTQTSLYDVKFSIPPLSEQIAIISYIEKETSTINQTIATIEKEIALVQEYRTALIAEAVTGKIDVRDFEVPGMGEEEESFEEMEEELSFEEEEAEDVIMEEN